MRIVKNIYRLNMRNLIVMLSFVFLLSSCGDDESSFRDTGDRGGSINMNLVWDISKQQRIGDRSPSGDVCEDYAIDTVEVTVINSSDSIIASENWLCSAHTGTIYEVPQGSDITLTISGIVAENTDWQGQATGISVVGGQNTNIGTVVMRYIGDDVTPPYIASHFPASDDTEVPYNSIIEIQFSEDVVFASVKSAIALVGTDTVPGTVTYNPLTMTSTFTPEIDLIADTSYSVTISDEIEDFAGLQMDESLTWSFTTGMEEDTIPPTTPSLLDVTAVSYSQTDLSWEASSDDIGVRQYKIYRNGSHIKSVSTTWATDTGLSPVTDYCYTIIAMDLAGNESAPSNEICEQTQAVPSPAVPTLISPQNGEELDNGCPTSPDGIFWYFDWSDAANATKYNIYVIGPNGLNPLIDTEVSSSSHDFTATSYIRDDDRIGWTWRVRSGNDYGQWSEWSQESNFNVELTNTDCP